jgi:CheY-like chemotaxis protein/two-component sensor histidine kinase
MEARIIDDLLDLTRIARGKVELRLQTIDAHASLRHALEVCQEQIEARQIEINLHLWAAQHHVNADPARLQQIFWNLIGNAVKFTQPRGRIVLRSSNDAQGRLVVEVSDTGIGIEPDLLPRLFNAFEQGERTVTRRFGGLGLGLTISKSLVELLGGTLKAQSSGTGLGATFTVTLPVVSAPKTDPRGPDHPRKSERIALRLLLVEDHEDTLRIMVRLLRAYGYTVSPASTVAEAVSLAETEKFDLLISDLGLPDGSGLDVIRHIKAKQHIPGIALSGFGMDEDIIKSKAAGFDHHMTKPVNIESLETMIQHLAARQRSPSYNPSQ